MEWKIGEIRQVNGEWCQCVVALQGCRECSFRTQDYCTSHSECMSLLRSDGRSVIFKKLEKVGRNYEYFIQGMGNIMVQEYILANANYIWEYNQDIVVMDCQNGRVAIEIKQNKENIEEKKLMYQYFTIESRTSNGLEDDVKTVFITTEMDEAIKEFNNCSHFCSQALDSTYTYSYTLYGWINNREKKIIQECDNLDQ